MRPLHHALRWLPSVVLVVVALHQIVLARTVGLSAWSGGGFGMFSTADAGSTRHLHVFVHRPGLRRELGTPSSLDDAVRRALTLPSDTNLTEIAEALSDVATPDHGPASSVEVQVWQTRYAPRGLEPSGHILRSLDVPIARD